MSSQREQVSLGNGAEQSTTHIDTTVVVSPRHDGSKTMKRKRPFGGSLNAAYSSVSSFTARPSTGRPDSPHFFFKSSLAVSFKHDKKDDAMTATNTDHVRIPQVVHQHVNGLCIVTVAESISSCLPPSSIVESVRFVVQEAPTCSAAEKRKKQAKMLKGGTVVGAIMPSTVIAELVVVTVEGTEEEQHHDDLKTAGPKLSPSKHSTIVPLYACVWGTILELNHRLTPELLRDDPLLDGYLAVILPSGRFPPPISMNSAPCGRSNNADVDYSGNDEAQKVA